MPSKIRGGTKDKHLADMHIPRVSSMAKPGTSAFNPASVSGYSRDWNFADITKLYTDTAGTLPVAADADPIGAVLCSAGSTVKLSAAADARRPTYKTAIQNGLSVARFDETDDYLTNATGITADASQTIILVLQRRSAISGNPHVLSLTTNNSLYASTPVGYYYWNGSAVSCGGTPTNWNIVVLKHTSLASLSIYINGGAPTTFDPNDSYAAATVFRLCADQSGNNPGGFDIGRAIVYSDALSNANLDYVIGGLGTLYNITTSAVS